MVKLENIILGTLVLVLIVLIAGASWVFLSESPQQLSPTDDLSDIQSLTKYWSNDIQSYGAQIAYGHFKEEYKDFPNEAHGLTHLFTSLVYEDMGSAGIKICDDAFGNGCYHGLVSSAIVNEGTGVLDDIVDLCIYHLGNETGSCFHGVGHGIMEYLGGESLEEALRYCDTLEKTDAETVVEDCVEGVFMDYTVPLGSGPRYFEVAHRFAPCDEKNVQEKFLAKCYYSLPHWWFQLEGVEVNDIAKWCGEITDENAFQCFKGMGIDLPGKVDYDQQKIVVGCQSIVDENGSKACLENSLRTLISLNIEACYLKEFMDIDVCS